MTNSEAKELQRLREENTRLKRLLGQAELEKAAWKELSEGNFAAQLAVMMPSGISLGWATPQMRACQIVGLSRSAYRRARIRQGKPDK